MKYSNVAVAAILLLLTGCTNGKSTEKIPAVGPFDVKKYLGTWHEAARMPHRFEKGMECVTAEYTMKDDGTIRVRNRGFRNGKECVANGIVRQKKDGTGELEVSFFRPFYGDYKIIALKTDYSAALITSSTKDYAWMLVRDPEQAKTILPEYTALLQQWGFDTEKLIYPRLTGK